MIQTSGLGIRLSAGSNFDKIVLQINFLSANGIREKHPKHTKHRALYLIIFLHFIKYRVDLQTEIL